jgi:hypothetical protein
MLLNKLSVGSQIFRSPANRTENISGEREDFAFSELPQRRNESKRYQDGRDHLFASVCCRAGSLHKLNGSPIDAAMFGLDHLIETFPSIQALDMEFLQDIETMRRLPRFSSKMDCERTYENARR